MRYFFHIVDRYGLFQDMIGFACATRNDAARHAEHMAAELAKAGELFRAAFVLVTHSAAPSSVPDFDLGLWRPGTSSNSCGRSVLPSRPTENP